MIISSYLIGTKSPDKVGAATNQSRTLVLFHTVKSGDELIFVGVISAMVFLKSISV